MRTRFPVARTGTEQFSFSYSRATWQRGEKILPRKGRNVVMIAMMMMMMMILLVVMVLCHHVPWAWVEVLGSQIYDSRLEICHSVSCHSDFPMYFEPNQPKDSNRMCVCRRKKGLSTQRGELQRCHQRLFHWQLAYLNGVAAAHEPRGAFQWNGGIFEK